MTAIRIRMRIDSETLHLPELKGMIGREVEIIVLDEAGTGATAPAVGGGGTAAYDFWNGPSAEEQAAAQGVKPIGSIEELAHPDLADAFDGFEEALEQWRKEPWRSGEEIDLGKDE